MKLLPLTTFFNSRKIVRSFLIGVLCAVTVPLVYDWLTHTDTYDYRTAAEACRASDATSEKVDCWYEVLRQAHDQHGTALTFEVFDYLYENEPDFVGSGGCHLHAHQLGDFLYYNSYRIHQDFDAIEFPPGSQVCGYGIYHGFFEHLIQDRPEADYIEEACDYFERRLGKEMPDIGPTCYHGSGHGLAIAVVDEGDTTYWGDYLGIVEGPLSVCDELDANQREVMECRMGVFNVLMNWMDFEEHGLSFNEADPFWICREQPERRKFTCYIQTAMKLDNQSNRNIGKLVDIIDDMEETEYQKTVFSAAVPGYIIDDLAAGKSTELIAQCPDIPTEFQDLCISSAVDGLIEHGNPGEEHVLAIDACTLDVLSNEQQTYCLDTILKRLQRFYSDEHILNLCDSSANQDFQIACSRFSLDETY